MLLENKELKEINGGKGIGFAVIFGGIVSFIVGIIAGFTNPLACNKN